MNERISVCPYCGSQSSIQTQQDMAYNFVTCPACGRFECVTIPDIFGADVKDKVSSYLYYTGKVETHSDRRFYHFIGSKDVFDAQVVKNPWSHFVSIAEVEAFYPKTFSEKIDRILLLIAKKTQFWGDRVQFQRCELLSAFFIRRFDNSANAINEEAVNCQLQETHDYLERNQYMECCVQGEVYTYVIKSEGYKRLDSLQAREAQTSKNVFVAMSFAADMANARDAIKNAIVENGYTPRIMDEIEHNHQIVPEMLYEIKTSRFVVAELTGHNNGAYFEAGFALGCGKEVIQVCQKDCFGKDGHFDVKQINTILWVNEEDLKQRLSSRIRATIK